MMIDVDWRQPFINYLSEQKVPLDKNLAEQLIRHAKSYVLVGDKLYRRGASSGVLMKCVPRKEGKGILEEIHKGVCGNHASSRTLVSKAFRRAFYWPTALGDAEELVRRCQGCQYFAKQQHVSAYKLVTRLPTWLFSCWELDMIGPSQLRQVDSTEYWWPSTSSPSGSRSSRSHAPRLTEYSTS
jgi:hypothetical protein